MTSCLIIFEESLGSDLSHNLGVGETVCELCKGPECTLVEGQSLDTKACKTQEGSARGRQGTETKLHDSDKCSNKDSDTRSRL